MNKIKNIAICLLFVFFIISCSNSADKAKIAYYEEQINELQKELKNSQNSSETQNTTDYNQDSYSDNNSNSQPNHSGTYEITDVNGKKWTFVLNPDESVIVEDGGNTYYGQWEASISLDYNPWITFDRNDYPKLQFPQPINKDHYLAIDVENGLIYGNPGGSYKSKNPKKRLPIKKIK